MTKVVTASDNQTLDLLLELVCVQVQLTTTQDEKARGHYDAVADWLSREGSSLRGLGPYIFPQGSQRLGTTTKPLQQAEFDLDAICLMMIRGNCHPGVVYQLLWDRLWESNIYRPMMKRMPRCIRLGYAGDFHLDIAPAIPDLECGGTCLLAPNLDADLAVEDVENTKWKSTNPQGYAEWFEDRCISAMGFSEKFARSQVDAVPEREPVHAKAALKRSVQLFKRWRDVEYADRKHLAPPSIILTTLSAQFYGGQQLCTDALGDILESTVRQVESGQRIRLTNPAHPSENICEKWDSNPSSYRDFCNAVTAFRDRWVRLQRLRGLHEIGEELSGLFGDSPVRTAITKMAERHVSVPRENRTLRVQPRSLGILVPASVSTSGLSIRPNTFYGD